MVLAFTLLIFLLTSHKVTKYRFAEKKERGMSESDDGHRDGRMLLQTVVMPA